jgi:hypothetical protein
VRGTCQTHRWVTRPAALILSGGLFRSGSDTLLDPAPPTYTTCRDSPGERSEPFQAGVSSWELTRRYGRCEPAASVPSGVLLTSAKAGP